MSRYNKDYMDNLIGRGRHDEFDDLDKLIKESYAQGEQDAKAAEDAEKEAFADYKRLRREMREKRKKKAEADVKKAVKHDENSNAIVIKKEITTESSTASNVKSLIDHVNDIKNDVIKLYKEKTNIIENLKNYSKKSNLEDIKKSKNYYEKSLSTISKIDDEISEQKKLIEYIKSKEYENTKEYQEFINSIRNVLEIQQQIDENMQKVNELKKKVVFIRRFEDVDNVASVKDKAKLSKLKTKLDNANREYNNLKNDVYSNDIPISIRDLLADTKTNSLFTTNIGMVIKSMKKHHEENKKKLNEIKKKYSISNNIFNLLKSSSDKDIKNFLLMIVKNRNIENGLINEIETNLKKLEPKLHKLTHKLEVIKKKREKKLKEIERLKNTNNIAYERLKKDFKEIENIRDERNKLIESKSGFLTLNRKSNDMYLETLDVYDNGIRAIKLYNAKYTVDHKCTKLRKHNEKIKKEIEHYFYAHGGTEDMKIFLTYCHSHYIVYNDKKRQFIYYDKYGDTMGVFENREIPIEYRTTNPSQYVRKYSVTSYGLITMLDIGRKIFTVSSGVNVDHNMFSNYARITDSGGISPEGLFCFKQENWKIETNSGVLSGIGIKKAINDIMYKHLKELNDELDDFSKKINDMYKKMKRLTDNMKNNKRYQQYENTKDKIKELEIDESIIKDEEDNLIKEIENYSNEVSENQEKLNRLTTLSDDELRDASQILDFGENERAIKTYNSIIKERDRREKSLKKAKESLTDARKKIKREYNKNVKEPIRNLWAIIDRNKETLKLMMKRDDIKSAYEKYKNFVNYNKHGSKLEEKKLDELFKKKEKLIKDSESHKNNMMSFIILKPSIKKRYDEIEAKLESYATELENIDGNKIDAVLLSVVNEHKQEIIKRVQADEEKIKAETKKRNDKMAKEMSKTKKADVKIEADVDKKKFTGENLEVAKWAEQQKKGRKKRTDVVSGKQLKTIIKKNKPVKRGENVISLKTTCSVKQQTNQKEEKIIKRYGKNIVKEFKTIEEAVEYEAERNKVAFDIAMKRDKIKAYITSHPKMNNFETKKINNWLDELKALANAWGIAF